MKGDRDKTKSRRRKRLNHQRAFGSEKLTKEELNSSAFDDAEKDKNYEPKPVRQVFKF